MTDASVTTTELTASAATAPIRPGNSANANLRRYIGTQILVDVIIPVAVFYVLRNAFDVPVIAASLISCLVPAIRTVARLITMRTVDVLGIVMLTLFVVGGTVSVIEGNPRILYAKDGWLTGLFGVWILVSLLMRRPFMLAAGRTIATVKIGHEGAAQWEARWENEPQFRFSAPEPPSAQHERSRARRRGAAPSRRAVRQHGSRTRSAAESVTAGSAPVRANREVRGHARGHRGV